MQQPNSDFQRRLTQKIVKWKARLANLGRRNPLIKFKQDSPRSLKILTDEPNILFKNITEGKKLLKIQIQDSEYQDITLLKENQKLPAKKNSLELITRQTGYEQIKRLKKIRSEARRSFEELGVNSLFLVLGTLTWYDKDEPEDALLSPLILVPVELTKERGRDIYKIAVLDEDIVLNPALAQKLKQNFAIDFPEAEIIQELNYSEIIALVCEALSEQNKWEIKDNVFLSLFSYAKAAMVRDIIDNEALIFNHSILQAISGDLNNYQLNYQEPLAASALDSQIKPERIFQILDADSSQQVVIEAAKSGSSFVVQGPPGTGKSQTIINMIAELIGDGKSVLLVAEKETALSVVYKRMAECSLDHICLNLHHSGTTDKRELVNNLSRTIDFISQVSEAENHQLLFERLVSTRQSLNLYLTSLHSKQKPLDKSPFEIFGELLKKEQQEVPNINVIFSNFNQWNQSRLHETKDLLSQLAKFLPLFKGDKTTIWAKSYIKSYSYELELEIQDNIQDFQQAIDSIKILSQQLEEKLQIQSLSNLETLENCYPAVLHIAKAPLILPEDWLNVDVSAAKNAYNHLRENIQFLEEKEALIKQKYNSDLFCEKLPTLNNRFQKYSTIWLFRIFNLKYKNDLKILNELYNQSDKISYHDLKRDLSIAVRVQEIRNQLSEDNYSARYIFGKLFNPDISCETELNPIKDALNWLTKLQKYSVDKTSIEQFINYPNKRRELERLIQKLELTSQNIKQGIYFLLSHFDESDITDSYLPINQIPFLEIERFLKIAQSELSDFQEWLTYKEIYQKLENLGTKKFLDALRDNNLEPKLWFPILEKRIYQTCLDAILAKQPELKNFNVEIQEQQIKEFSKFDSYQLDAAKERLKQRHLQHWEEQEKTSVIQAELLRLKKEATKKSRHLAIRKLLNDNQKGIPNLVKALKPCWMMSPLSVSQYVNPNIVHFDVLIFDEASQLRTEDVVPSIIRSDQVIVIGDRKQLPPTSFFSTGDSEEDVDDDDDAKYESVLDECSNFMFVHTLKWHYRSQDERLIAFSNKHFYNSQLVTFPNPVQNPDLGVWFKHVPDGIYDRGGRRDNRREAEVVAQLTLEHFQNFPEQSLGIIAFSEAQADAIGEQIEILVKEYPDLETFCSDNSPQFFIKALENVQGDERDAIIISVGYARDSQGKFFLNFGPLIKQGGERRLNVAVTRAKRKLTLVSSIVAGDVDTTRTKSEGVRLLRDYLEYAASGGERLEGNSYSDKMKFDSLFEEDVYNTLAEKGYIIRTQVGCSGYRIDLGVVNKNHPGEFLLGIECDGASYHSSPTARDRDRLRQQVLERLGWKIHRIWSTDWFRNKPAQVRLLTDKIEHLQQMK